MRDDFYFIHRVNEKQMYHAKLVDDDKQYEISWTDERGNSDFTHYTVYDTENAIEKGDWIIQII